MFKLADISGLPVTAPLAELAHEGYLIFDLDCYSTDESCCAIIRRRQNEGNAYP
jgi:hypothetical protein